MFQIENSKVWSLLESVLDVPRNLCLKFHQNRVSNNRDNADIGCLLGVGVQSHFRFLPNLKLCLVKLSWSCDNKNVQVIIVTKNQNIEAKEQKTRG